MAGCFGFFIEFGRCRVHGDGNVGAGTETGLPDRSDDQLERLLVAFQVRRKSAFIANSCGQLAALEDFLQGMKNLDAPLQCFAESRCADRHDHEFLQVDAVVGMFAAVDDVHHRHGEDVSLHAAEILVKLQSQGFGCRLGCSQRNGEDGIGAQPALVFGSIELGQKVVKSALIQDIEAFKFRSDQFIDVAHRIENAEAQIASRIFVPELDSLEGSG